MTKYFFGAVKFSAINSSWIFYWPVRNAGANVINQEAFVMHVTKMAVTGFGEERKFHLSTELMMKLEEIQEIFQCFSKLLQSYVLETHFWEWVLQLP